MKIGIFFGSTTGNTERIADIISETFQESSQVNYIENFRESDIEKFDLIIFGIPTWNVGELESTWEEILPLFDDFDFKGKFVAIYGLGDQVIYSYTFQDAMGILYDKLIERNANLIGEWPIEGYEVEESLAIKNNKFVGLALDEDNQNEKTDERVKRWVKQLKKTISDEKSEMVTLE